MAAKKKKAPAPKRKSVKADAAKIGTQVIDFGTEAKTGARKRKPRK
jgi:hypothetical protein